MMRNANYNVIEKLFQEVLFQSPFGSFRSIETLFAKVGPIAQDEKQRQNSQKFSRQHIFVYEKNK